MSTSKTVENLTSVLLGCLKSAISWRAVQDYAGMNRFLDIAQETFPKLEEAKAEEAQGNEAVMPDFSEAAQIPWGQLRAGQTYWAALNDGGLHPFRFTVEFPMESGEIKIEGGGFIKNFYFRHLNGNPAIFDSPFKAADYMIFRLEEWKASQEGIQADPIDLLGRGDRIRFDELITHWESLSLQSPTHSADMKAGAEAMKRRMLQELRQFQASSFPSLSGQENENG